MNLPTPYRSAPSALPTPWFLHRPPSARLLCVPWLVFLFDVAYACGGGKGAPSPAVFCGMMILHALGMIAPFLFALWGLLHLDACWRFMSRRP